MCVHMPRKRPGHIALTKPALNTLHALFTEKKMLKDGHFPCLEMEIHEHVDFSVDGNKNRVTAIGYLWVCMGKK